MKLLSRLKNSRIGSSISYSIKPRKVKFEWQDTPVDWIPNQPFVSYFINEINMILPAGEFWFCRLYNKVLPKITDEKLAEDVKAFIRQEAMHANAHTSANKEYLSARNIDIQRNLDIMNYLFTTALADKPFDKEVPQFLQGQWDLLRLGVIATVYLGIKHKLTLPKENGDCVLTTGEKISSFLFPGMIIPFLLLKIDISFICGCKVTHFFSDSAIFSRKIEQIQPNNPPFVAES